MEHRHPIPTDSGGAAAALDPTKSKRGPREDRYSGKARGTAERVIDGLPVGREYVEPSEGEATESWADITYRLILRCRYNRDPGGGSKQE